MQKVRMCSGGVVNTQFVVKGALKNYFKAEEFFANYSEELDEIPYGIAVIPFVCNVLPIVWLTDAVLELDELDKDFYNCIEKLKFGYEEMYPRLSFKGRIDCMPIKYVPKEKERRSLTFFSGGVDAFATLLAHIDENPTLFSICGADIKLNNKAGWSVVMKQIDEVSKTLNLPAIQCYSNFREFVDEEKLCGLVAEAGANEDYYFGFQHGIGLIGHAAPLAYQYGYMMNYIASSYTIRERPYITCASDPRIDNNVEFCGAKVHHDLFEYNRQEKINHIVDYCNKHRRAVKLRVCWHSDRGENCCKCEKCYRTICGLIAEGANPKEYGLNVDAIDLLKLRTEIWLRNVLHKKRKMLPPDGHSIPFWTEIKDRYIENKTNIPLRWRISSQWFMKYV